MLLKTKYFGGVDCGEDALLSFPEGLFAFEEEKEYALLPFAGSDGAMLCLQSTATPALAFVVMNPFTLKSDYAPVLHPDELKLLGAAESRELCFYTLCVVKDPISESTVNLRCPVAVNPDARVAMQVILESEDYHMRHLLREFNGKKGAQQPC